MLIKNIYYIIIPNLIYLFNSILNFFLDKKKGYFLTQDIKSYNTGKKEYIIVVAHPDDEMLFFGEFIISNCNKVKVVCITNSNNKIRSNEFIKIMKHLKVDYEMWNYLDSKNCTGCNELNTKLYNVIQGYDRVYTHSSLGETGHPMHIMLHNYIYKLTNKNMYTFDMNVINIKNLFQCIHMSEIKKNMLDLYVSQKNVIKWHLYLSSFERHVNLHN